MSITAITITHGGRPVVIDPNTMDGIAYCSTRSCPRYNAHRCDLTPDRPLSSIMCEPWIQEAGRALQARETTKRANAPLPPDFESMLRAMQKHGLVLFWDGVTWVAGQKTGVVLERVEVPPRHLRPSGTARDARDAVRMATAILEGAAE